MVAGSSPATATIKGIDMSGFECPDCGGTYFGSSTNEDGTLTYHCHGDADWHGCDFSCHQDDFEKYHPGVNDCAGEKVIPKSEYINVDYFKVHTGHIVHLKSNPEIDMVVTTCNGSRYDVAWIDSKGRAQTLRDISYMCLLVKA